MRVIGFYPEALSEFQETVRYYNSQHPGLGDRFRDAIREALHRMEAHPQLYPVVEDNIRQCRVRRFPYGILFRVRSDRLEIIAVMHLRREPGYWKERTSQ